MYFTKEELQVMRANRPKRRKKGKTGPKPKSKPLRGLPLYAKYQFWRFRDGLSEIIFENESSMRMRVCIRQFEKYNPQYRWYLRATDEGGGKIRVSRHNGVRVRRGCKNFSRKSV